MYCFSSPRSFVNNSLTFRDDCSFVRPRISSVISGVFRPDVAGDKTCGEFNSNPRRMLVRSPVGVMMIGALSEGFVKLSSSFDPIPGGFRGAKYKFLNVQHLEDEFGQMSLQSWFHRCCYFRDFFSHRKRTEFQQENIISSLQKHR